MLNDVTSWQQHFLQNLKWVYNVAWDDLTTFSGPWTLIQHPVSLSSRAKHNGSPWLCQLDVLGQWAHLDKASLMSLPKVHLIGPNPIYMPSWCHEKGTIDPTQSSTYVSLYDVLEQGTFISHLDYCIKSLFHTIGLLNITLSRALDFPSWFLL